MAIREWSLNASFLIDKQAQFTESRSHFSTAPANMLRLVPFSILALSLLIVCYCLPQPPYLFYYPAVPSDFGRTFNQPPAINYREQNWPFPITFTTTTLTSTVISSTTCTTSTAALQDCSSSSRRRSQREIAYRLFHANDEDISILRPSIK
jgi:hypothetical protein